MSIKSDITINAAAFHPKSISEETQNINVMIENFTASGPQWWEVGAAKFREMRESGETHLPIPTYLPAAWDASVPSRDPDREILLRVYNSDNGDASKGVNGGGFVLGNQKQQDGRLRTWANAAQITAISVGYRNAPEDPYPAAVNDCFDAADYLVDHAENVFGAKVLFLGGESAGACFASLTAFHLMRSRPAHRLAGLILPFGTFDLTLNMPHIVNTTRSLVIDHGRMQRFVDAYTPGMSIEERRNPLVSPMYEDMQALALASPHKSLPPALFLCGTQDPLLDDTLMMGVKWMAAGGEAIVKLYPGAAHGFTMLAQLQIAQEAEKVQSQFLNEKIASYE